MVLVNFVVIVLMTGHLQNKLVQKSAHATQPKAILDDDVKGKDAKCSGGHITGMPAVCGSDGCLTTLIPATHSIHTTDQHTEFTHEDDIHADIVYQLSQLQWAYGVYGSVGQIGLDDSSMLSEGVVDSIHTQAGEKLVVSDMFIQHTGQYPHTATQLFTETMQIDGFSPYIGGKWSAKQFYLHKGLPWDVTKELLVALGVEQFRLICVGSAGIDPYRSMYSLQRAACFIRDGGIVIIESLYDSNPHAPYVIQQYFQSHSHQALTPFLVTKDKIYLCTANWKSKYTTFLKSYAGSNNNLFLHEIQTADFGMWTSYLTISNQRVYRE